MTNWSSCAPVRPEPRWWASCGRRCHGFGWWGCTWPTPSWSSPARKANSSTACLPTAPSVLGDRVLIEQAKGVFAERQGIDPDTAFAVMCDRATRHGRRLIDVAADILAGPAVVASPEPETG
jgi:hypothetical protein